MRGVLLVLITACASPASTRMRVAPTGSELNFSYDDKLYLYQGTLLIDDGPTFSNLPEITHCVEDAHRHDKKARRAGRKSRVLRGIGAVLGVASVGGFAGLGQDDPETALTYLGAGIGVATLGLVFVAAGHDAQIQAQGNAVDSANYWNDAMGFEGRSCP